MKKAYIMLAFLTIMILLPALKVNAAYNYGPFAETIESADAMIVKKVIDNSNLVDETGNRAPIQIGNVKDVKVHENRIYLSDELNHKIIILNDQMEFIKVFPSTEEETLKNPQGIFLKEKYIYICDFNNERVAIFDLETEVLIKEIKAPSSEPVFETIGFKPLKITVDRVGRMHLIVNNIFEGIMEFDENGEFSRYYGTKQLSLSFMESIVYALSSQNQKSKMALKLQTSFTSIEIDKHGYIYAVSKTDTSDPIKKLNFKGKDILQKSGYVSVLGDVIYQDKLSEVPKGPSQIIDVTVHEDNNRYSVLDSTRNRIFTYDSEGYLLYIFGKKGSQSNEIEGPSSLAYMGENIIVSDALGKSIIVYEPTTFGKLVNEATEAYFLMDYDKAKTIWEKVLEQNSNYFLAYAGIGKSELRNNQYEEALYHLKLGYDYYNYSKAYQAYRNQKMASFLPYVLVIGLIGLGALLGFSLKKSVQREKDDGA